MAAIGYSLPCGCCAVQVGFQPVSRHRDFNVGFRVADVRLGPGFGHVGWSPATGAKGPGETFRLSTASSPLVRQSGWAVIFT